MILNRLWSFLEEQVFPVNTKQWQGKPLFNLYNDSVPGMDIQDAQIIRRQNLYNYLDCFRNPPPVMLLGEAPGWRGCRFSGVPFTSEHQITSGRLPFGGKQSSAKDKPYKEASATMFWDVSLPFYANFLFWNCIPFHPFPDSNQLKNRTVHHTDIQKSIPLLEGVISALAPDMIIAIGNKASYTLNLLGIHHHKVRHPSHGGYQQFKSGLVQILSNHHK